MPAIAEKDKDEDLAEEEEEKRPAPLIMPRTEDLNSSHRKGQPQKCHWWAWCTDERLQGWWMTWSVRSDKYNRSLTDRVFHGPKNQYAESLLQAYNPNCKQLKNKKPLPATYVSAGLKDASTQTDVVIDPQMSIDLADLADLADIQLDDPVTEPVPKQLPQLQPVQLPQLQPVDLDMMNSHPATDPNLGDLEAGLDDVLNEVVAADYKQYQEVAAAVEAFIAKVTDIGRPSSLPK
jgi:hypothetical protein